VGLLRTGRYLHRLRNDRNLYEADGRHAFCFRRVARLGILADPAGHSTFLSSYRIAVGASWMERSTREQKGAKMKNEPEDIPAAYLLYMLLGILLVTAGAVLYIVRLF
jgi:hypothetical protein